MADDDDDDDAQDCTGPLGCGHVHVASSPGRCWEAACHPTCPCRNTTD